MPKTREQKGKVIDSMTAILKDNPQAVVTDFERLTMVDLDAFRAKAREKGIRYTIVKPTLVEIAAKNAGIEGLSLTKTGKSYAFATGGKDEIDIAKAVYEFTKSSDNRVHIAAGIVAGQVVSAETIMQLATLPSYEELLGRMVGTMNAPISNLVYSLNWNLQSFYNVVKAMQAAKS